MKTLRDVIKELVEQHAGLGHIMAALSANPTFRNATIGDVTQIVREEYEILLESNNPSNFNGM